MSPENYQKKTQIKLTSTLPMGFHPDSYAYKLIVIL